MWGNALVDLEGPARDGRLVHAWKQVSPPWLGHPDDIQDRPHKSLGGTKAVVRVPALLSDLHLLHRGKDLFGHTFGIMVGQKLHKYIDV